MDNHKHFSATWGGVFKDFRQRSNMCFQMSWINLDQFFSWVFMKSTHLNLSIRSLTVMSSRLGSQSLHLPSCTPSARLSVRLKRDLAKNLIHFQWILFSVLWFPIFVLFIGTKSVLYFSVSSPRHWNWTLLLAFWL